MKLLRRWKEGLGIGLRLTLLGILMGIIMLPTKIVEVLSEEYVTLGGWLLVAYLLTIVPLFLPVALETCGLGVRSSGEFDMRGGMNKASRRKTEDLEREAAAREARNI